MKYLLNVVFYIIDLQTPDLFVGKTLLHGDVLMWLMKTLLTSGCTNQRGAGQPFYFSWPQPTKLTGGRYSVVFPDVIACQIDMLPA